jgi:hypothetical protein
VIFPPAQWNLEIFHLPRCKARGTMQVELNCTPYTLSSMFVHIGIRELFCRVATAEFWRWRTYQLELRSLNARVSLSRVYSCEMSIPEELPWGGFKTKATCRNGWNVMAPWFLCFRQQNDRPSFGKEGEYMASKSKWGPSENAHCKASVTHLKPNSNHPCIQILKSLVWVIVTL